MDQDQAEQGLADQEEATAQEEDEGGSAAAQANNPLADFRALNFQNYYIPEISGDVDYSTGHIEFSGSVVIEGSVKPLFRVKATGSVTIGGNIEKYKSYPRIVSIQNPYSLLNRSFEVGLAEFSQREKVGLLAYSPLANNCNWRVPVRRE